MVLGPNVLGMVGFAVAIIGVIAAWSGADRFIGLASLVVGRFLLTLPLRRPHEEE